MVFHRGRLPNEKLDFVYGGRVLEVVTTFCYLGFWLTVQLSFTRHLEATIAKARARIGLIFAKLPLMHIPLHLVKEVWQIFIAPLFYYGLSLWISHVSQSSVQALDSLWTKFLKRYFCLPAWANNAMILFTAETQPFSKSLKMKAPQWLGGLSFPESFSGMRLSFLENIEQVSTEEFNPIPLIPTPFWNSRIIVNIPMTMFYRKRLMHEIFDIKHMEICNNSTFHTHADQSCICKICFKNAHMHHNCS